MKKIVFLTGAGMSAESGISTFRDSGGLWEQHDVQQVASIDGWKANPELVQRFYNERRAQLDHVEPNAGHKIIAALESDFDVTIVTQNVDNLHERAGSKHIVHLHGELTKACNESKTLVYDIGTRPILPGEKADDGTRLRPFIVWFGEAVPLIGTAARLVEQADIIVIVGTSMQVYPAASLINYASPASRIYLVDPAEVPISSVVTVIKEKAGTGLAQLRQELLRH